MKKGFTLIELLIVVAIIGILAGVGIPMYNGYMVNAKIETTRTNYSIAKSFIANSLNKCSAGSQYIELPGVAELGIPERLSCNKTAEEMNDPFGHYLTELAGMKNPYNNSYGVSLHSGFKKYGNCPLGYICMYGSGNKINIWANIGDENGGDVFLKDIIVKE